MIQLDAGDIIKMKKKHPCGSDEWQIVKTGADVKLRCCGCSHEIILKRSLVEKNTKKIQKKENKEIEFISDSESKSITTIIQVI